MIFMEKHPKLKTLNNILLFKLSYVVSPFFKYCTLHSINRQTSLTCLPDTSRLHLSQNIQFPTGSRKRPPLVCRDAIRLRYIGTEESGAKTSIKISSQDWMQPEQRRCRVAQAAVIYLFVFVTSDKFICPTTHLSSHQWVSHSSSLSPQYQHNIINLHLEAADGQLHVPVHWRFCCNWILSNGWFTDKKC